MFKAMMRKELMETRPVIALAGFFYALILVADVVDYSWAREKGALYRLGRWSAVLNNEWIDSLWLLTFAFALLVGLVQTLADSVQGTWGYLMHLPPGRRWMLSSKLLAGGGAYCGCTGLFLLMCVIIGWARQTEAYPFRWSMMSSYAQIALIGLLVYLTAFLTGLRPARWYGSRLLPLMGGGLLVWLLIALPHWWVYGLVSLMAVCGLLVGLILYVGDIRDYA